MGNYVIGIDLGTTKSVVTVYENGQPKVLENLMGKRITPSYVALKTDKKTNQNTWVIGDAAKNQVVVNPLKTIYGVKRLIGRRFNDPEVSKMQELASYKIVKGPNGDAWVEVNGEAMPPAQVSAMVLRELKKAAEKYLGNDANGNPIEVTDAVITCPAYFNDAQIKATKDAGTIAGLNVLRVIKEPTAAALAYGMDKKRNGKVIVYDLGGGTFDVSVLEVSIDEQEGSLIQVLSNNGDTFLGGENFDERIMEHLMDVLKEESGLNINGNANALQRIKEAAEKAKVDLSSQDSVDIFIPAIGMNEDGETVDFEYTLLRSKLEDLVVDLIERTKEPCKKALEDAGLTIGDIDEILLVGAQTRMPKVVETVTKLFGKPPRMDIAAQEIVAMGAAVQGAILDGKVDNVLLLDVTPLTIGIRAAGDVMSPMVPRNSTIPAQAKDVFSTSEDNQRNVEIMVYQGERPKASDNKLLGKFTLDGIPPAPRGKPQIEVTFDIDADGLLKVEAKELLSGRVQKIVVQANGGLSEAEVEKMLKDAEQNAAKDELFKKEQIANLEADKELKEIKQDIEEDYYKTAPADLKALFDENARELTEAVAQKDVEAILAKVVQIREIRTKLGEAFYDAAQGSNDNDAPDAPENKTSNGGPSGPSI